DELADTHLTAPQAILGHDDAGEAGDQGGVQVEERADLGTRRAGLDLGDRAGQPHGPPVGTPCRLFVCWCHRALFPFSDGGLGSSAMGVNDAGTERPSPPRARTSSNPLCRHVAKKLPSVTAARS